jgi:hypothetical protein
VESRDGLDRDLISNRSNIHGSFLCYRILTSRVEVEIHLLGVLLAAVLGQEHIGRGLGGPVLPESLHLSRVGDGQFLQQGESPVLGKVAVEGDGVGDT